VLGFDSLGLQQEFQHRATQDDADLWLPVFVNSTSEMLFFGAFGFDGYDRIEVQHAWPWCRENLMLAKRRGNGIKTRAMLKEPVFSLPNEGQTDTVSWRATEDKGTFWQSCFNLSGYLVLAPDAVAAACEAGGSFEGLLPAAAPIEWCKDGRFPTEYFRLEDDIEVARLVAKREGRPVISMLTTLEECAVFSGDDVRKLVDIGNGCFEGSVSNQKAAPSPAPPTPVAQDLEQKTPTGTQVPPSTRPIRPQREQNLLRVIAGLWALSDLPDAHNTTADKLSALFDTWGWEGPAKSTIADTILRPASTLPKGKT